MEDLLKLKTAQIEALQRELDIKTEKLNEANRLLSELAHVLEVNNFEIINPVIVN